jgi:hypothetical protein
MKTLFSLVLESFCQKILNHLSTRHQLNFPSLDNLLMKCIVVARNIFMVGLQTNTIGIHPSFEKNRAIDNLSW